MRIELSALMAIETYAQHCGTLHVCFFAKLVIHSNQIKLPMASSVDYIIS